MGGEPEKLLTLEEAARRLHLPADDVEAMIRQGRIPSFRLGGSLLRVRLQDVEVLRLRKSGDKREGFGVGASASPSPSLRTPGSFWERVIDFFYFNDFYIVVLVLLLTLLAIILTL